MIDMDSVSGFQSSTNAEGMHPAGILLATGMGTASGVDAPWPPSGLPARGPCRCVTRELSPSLPVPHPGGKQEIP